MSIGTDLKAARLARKISLEDMAARTKIPAKYLEALEEDRFDVFPSQTYVTGFIRAHAKMVGLDPQELTRRFKTETKPVEVRIEPMNAEAELEKTLGWKPTLHRQPVFRPANEEEALQETLDEDFGDNIQRESSVMRRKAQGIRRGRALRRVAQGTGLLLLTLGLAFLAVRWKDHLPSFDRLPSSTVQVPTPSDDTLPLVADKYQHLILKAMDKSWVLVATDDGKTRAQFELDAGTTRMFKALKNFRVRIGNAGGVEVQYNRTPLGVLGLTGQVVEVLLPPGPQGFRVPVDDAQDSRSN